VSVGERNCIEGGREASVACEQFKCNMKYSIRAGHDAEDMPYMVIFHGLAGGIAL